jgi:formate dehydrogenase
VPKPINIDIAAYKRGRLQADFGLLAGKHTREGLTKIMEDSGLRGLGGAGFPVGRKWKSVAGSPSRA